MERHVCCIVFASSLGFYHARTPFFFPLQFNSYYYFSVTEAQRLRQEHIQQAANRVKVERMRREEEKKQKQKEMSKLQKQVAKKTAAHDPMRHREKETAQKLATFK